MSIVSNTTLLLLLIPFLCALVIRQDRSQADQMCKVKDGILCVKDELIIIALIAKTIVWTTIEIETNIKQTTNFETLNRYINIEMNYSHSNLPVSDFHDAFSQYSNIDKEYLSELFSEAHDALIYYSNSIDHLLEQQSMLGEKTDAGLKEIQHKIKYDMICRFRNALSLYSQQWEPENDIDRMYFLKQARLPPSLTHDVHSIVILRYIRRWMEIINYVITNLEKKVF